MVHTNDPLRPITELGIAGNVLEFVRVSRRYIRFNGKAGNMPSQQIDILPVHPFKIEKVSAQPGRNIRIKWTQESRDNQPFYRVTVENMANTEGTYLEKIVIRTDSDIRTEFFIPVHGTIIKQ